MKPGVQVTIQERPEGQVTVTLVTQVNGVCTGSESITLRHGDRIVVNQQVVDVQDVVLVPKVRYE